MAERTEAAAITTATLAVGLGAGSLLLLAFQLFAGFRQLVDLGLRPVAALAWDAGLSGLFFPQHSGMVRRTVRSRVARACGERLVGVVYAAASAAAGPPVRPGPPGPRPNVGV